MLRLEEIRKLPVDVLASELDETIEGVLRK